MSKTLIGTLCFFLFSIANAVTIEYVPVVPEIALQSTSTPAIVEVSDMTITELIEHFGAKYDVSTSTLHKIVKCESRYNVNATNINAKEYSVGLVQINLKAHRVTEKVARDPAYSIEFLAVNISNGKYKSMWYTCSR